MSTKFLTLKSDSNRFDQINKLIFRLYRLVRWMDEASIAPIDPENSDKLIYRKNTISLVTKTTYRRQNLLSMNVVLSWLTMN